MPIKTVRGRSGCCLWTNKFLDLTSYPEKNECVSCSFKLLTMRAIFFPLLLLLPPSKYANQKIFRHWAITSYETKHARLFLYIIRVIIIVNRQQAWASSLQKWSLAKDCARKFSHQHHTRKLFINFSFASWLLRHFSNSLTDHRDLLWIIQI